MRGVEELRYRQGAGEHAGELVHGRLVAGDRGQQLLHLRRRGDGQVGELAGELVHWQRPLVAALLVPAQRLVVAVAAAPGGVEGVGAQLGVVEGVGDALGGDRVLGVPGVTDQRPARPVRCPEPVRHSFAHDPGFLPPAVEPVAEDSGDLAQVVALQVLFHLGHLGLRPGGKDQRQVVVGGDQADNRGRAGSSTAPPRRAPRTSTRSRHWPAPGPRGNAAR